jgi:hypothetical protein
MATIKSAMMASIQEVHRAHVRGKMVKRHPARDIPHPGIFTSADASRTSKLKLPFTDQVQILGP